MKSVKYGFIFDDVHLPPDKQIGRHSQDSWELSLVVMGSGIRSIGDHAEPMKRGEVILVPPHMPHRWIFDDADTDAEGNIHNLTLMFGSDTLVKLGDLLPEFRSIADAILGIVDAIDYHDPVRARIAELMTAMTGLSAQARIPKVFEILSLLATPDRCHSVGGNNTIRSVEQKLNALRIFCTTNFARRITLQSAADHVGMSKSALCTFVRTHIQMTFTEYLNDIRLSKAVELLRDSEMNISTIAYDVGFASVPYFNRVFRNKFGRAPQIYRREIIG